MHGTINIKLGYCVLFTSYFAAKGKKDYCLFVCLFVCSYRLARKIIKNIEKIF